MKRKLPVRPKRIVIKVGTAILTSKRYRLNKLWIKKLVAQISAIINKNIEVILVTSGAIGAGMGMLKLASRPKLLPRQQAAAAGQSDCSNRDHRARQAERCQGAIHPPDHGDIHYGPRDKAGRQSGFGAEISIIGNRVLAKPNP